MLFRSGQHFRPEFINRVDEVVVFHPLQRDQIRGIAEIQLNALRSRLADQGMKLNLTDEAMDKICSAGFDPVYGARPVKRVIQRELENSLAQALLRGDFGHGDAIQADVKEGEIVFNIGH